MLTYDTGHGLITVSNSVFAEIIYSVMNSPEFTSKIWAATNSGRLIRLAKSWSDQENLKSLTVSLNDNGRITIAFGVVVVFGISIKGITRLVADRIVKRTFELTGMIPEEITMSIEGVRTKKRTARRNTKVVYHYDEDDWKNSTDGNQSE